MQRELKFKKAFTLINEGNKACQNTLCMVKTVILQSCSKRYLSNGSSLILWISYYCTVCNWSSQVFFDYKRRPHLQTVFHSPLMSRGTIKCYCTWNSNFLVILSTCHIMQEEELSWWMGGWYGRLLSNKLPWHVDPFTISTNWVSSELMFNQLELNQLEVFPILQVTHFEILPNWNLLGWNCEIWLKLWSLVEIVQFGWNCEIW